MNNNVLNVPCFDDGTEAKIFCYLPDNSPDIDKNRRRKTIILCPGGGYEFTSDREAEPVALKFCAQGYNVLILRYSVAPHRFPTALYELAYTVSLTRQYQTNWNVDPDHILVMGFSAGSHLACSLGTMWQESFLSEKLGIPNYLFRPNGMILSYPVITSGEYAHDGSFHALLGEKYNQKESFSLEARVSELTPPAFVWHTWNDNLVPVENSLLLAASMKKYQIPMELHIFPNGVHGLSLCNTLTAHPDQNYLINPHSEIWMDLCIRWIEQL